MIMSCSFPGWLPATFAASLVSAISATSYAAAPNLIATAVCRAQTSGVCFGSPPMPTTLTSINYKPSADGAVLVTVSGSGYCVFQDVNNEQTADFQTQITDNGTGASYKGPGGLRIKMHQPPTADPQNPVTAPFNLASSRVFTV